MTDDFTAFFERVTEHQPYPYQVRLATDAWSDVVEVPTGLGKTAGVVISWLWKRLQADADTPLRMVYCLPMRVLVEQTESNARKWIDAAAPAFREKGLQIPAVHVLMGGEVDVEWVHHPERPALIVGTQDMLLSRALMRGYGMSRYQWPIHFGLLHNAALWVYDEVQLMGPALPTSAQLEAFRRAIAPARPCRTVWMSATLDASWLDTVDFRPHVPELRIATIDGSDRERAARRFGAVKRLHRAEPRLEGSSATATRQYLDGLASAVLAAHRPGTQSLVIVNRVARAQQLYRRLVSAAGSATPILLLHSRFRPAERSGIESALREIPVEGRIVVATQAVEAGVDISSATLFTELAPWSSLVQRFGRCNRAGEVEGGADVYWLDMASDDGIAPPYEVDTLDEARSILLGLESAAIPDLPEVRAAAPLHPVLRRKDFFDLFDTEPDLSGFDIDISPYIRDTGAPQVQLFWRDFEGKPGDEEQPHRRELCSASMGQIGRFLEKRKKKADGPPYWTWDSLDERWMPSRPGAKPRPGAVLLVRSAAGGYASDVGFDPDERGPVPEVAITGPESDGIGSDPETAVGHFVSLVDHTAHVRQWVATLADALRLEDDIADMLDVAAIWHDVGKAHPAFQTALLDFLPADERDREGSRGTPWAKSSGRGRLRYRIEVDGAVDERRLFRHELASLVAWLAHGNGDDRIGYLIAAHHGKLRLALRSLPEERAAPEGRRFARGVWEGDVIPSVELDGLSVPSTEVRLDLMELGRGRQGPSWTERTQRLLDEAGPFRLAWLEALLRIADQRASAMETAVESLAAGGMAS